ncbi:xanthine dehydrogenase family protein subunit M [Altererythrobacter xixiisoli]|uniref:Xanthine dehydrogenase family protein subunit M n=1 Tax=Croceibacterium xixiisoli TaxID=1476466 RepID=A0A6I4TU05_9SPHN|nr:xanthine dehydrogenase family protein subunit M [Croceibacterium xixiisoli]MXO98631.1 xanthine dehydrogenase family protein subunit M [Croceibacterium xixiisoli]
MKAFAYARAAALADAQSVREGARIIAGGTNLLDLMKLEVETPDQLMDINHLPLSGIDAHGEGLAIGALVTNSDCAADLRVRHDYPLLAQAILAGASPQLRNKATTGGNLCQRTRCTYFTDTTQRCNKRAPGSGCGAQGGYTRLHAILGASDACIATYPGDMAVALAALDAQIVVEGVAGERMVAARDFHRLPADHPEQDNVLQPGDVITGVRLPAPAGGRHIYRKIRDRSSYAFALVSVAAIVTMANGRMDRVRIAFGGLAHKPWHDPEVEAALVGQVPDPALFDRAADILLRDAQGQGSNDFKIPLVRRALIATLIEATSNAPTGA